MLLDSEMLRLVFGVKLRQLRSQKELSLKDLAKKSNLSVSYLNEIENGKKYPKPEKIMILAEALDEKYENLISLELKEELAILQRLVESNMLSAIPFEIFGVPVQTIFQLLSEKPKRMRALIGTLLEIARAHAITIDDVFQALLRSYLDMHNNYFPSIESAAKSFAKKIELDWTQEPEVIKTLLKAHLNETYSVQVHEKNLSDLSPDLNDLLYFPTPNGKSFYLSNRINAREQSLILAREIGYRFLKLKARPATSAIDHLDSFEQLFNHFSAGYFASSVLIPELELVDDLKSFFASSTLQTELQRVLEKYPAPAESVFHRMTQLLPKHLGLKNIFYLRYEYDVPRKRFEIARELHLGQQQGPHRVRMPENYCGRWLIHKLTSAQLKSGESIQTGLQRSRYHDMNDEYLILAASFKKPLSDSISSVCLGLLIDSKFEKTVPVLESKALRGVVVGETCERCSVENCESRQAPMDPSANPQRRARIQQAIARL